MDIHIRCIRILRGPYFVRNIAITVKKGGSMR